MQRVHLLSVLFCVVAPFAAHGRVSSSCIDAVAQRLQNAILGCTQCYRCVQTEACCSVAQLHWVLMCAGHTRACKGNCIKKCVLCKQPNALGLQAIPKASLDPCLHWTGTMVWMRRPHGTAAHVMVAASIFWMALLVSAMAC